MVSPLTPSDPVRPGLPVDAFLMYVGGVSIFALIWLYYGLRHFQAQRSGIALVGYGSVALSVIIVIIVFIVGAIR
ncbi:MAG TPA: hypothetical protein VFI42_13400 [Thermomicrobiaceae bacterium]|nr:hypothetical protein [Thermomicrobiaceae bacterium]